MQSIRIVARTLVDGDEYVFPSSGLLPNVNEYRNVPKGTFTREMGHRALVRHPGSIRTGLLQVQLISRLHPQSRRYTYL